MGWGRAAAGRVPAGRVPGGRGWRRAPGVALVLALALAGPVPPAAAQVPDPGSCWQRVYDAAHLAAHPGQGVGALRLWFYDAYLGEADSRTVIIEASMADQGQGRRDGVGGLRLQSTLFCGAGPGQAPACLVECDGGGFTTEILPDGRLELVTEGAVVGLEATCGGASDLSEGGRTVYRLDPVPAAACADLAVVHPLPAPGCYGVAYARADAAGTVAAMTLWLAAPDLDAIPAFPWLEGQMAVDVAPAAPGMGPLAGARVMVPIWCDAASGTCRMSGEDGVWAVTLDGPDLVLTSSRFLLFDPDGVSGDLTRGGPVSHALTPLAPEACAGLAVE